MKTLTLFLEVKMTVFKLSEKLNLTFLNKADNIEITGAFASDLLSDVVGNTSEGNVLLSVQVHKNIVAVASLVGLAAVIITSGRTPDQSVIDAANGNGLNLLSSEDSTFTLSGKMYELGLRD